MEIHVHKCSNMRFWHIDMCQESGNHLVLVAQSYLNHCMDTHVWRVMKNDDRVQFSLKLSFTKLIEPPHDKTNTVAVRPAKTQISLGTRPV